MLALLALAVIACTASSESSKQRSDTSSSQQDATAQDAVQTDGWIGCQQSVANWCARASAYCIMDWPSDLTVLCSPSGFWIMHPADCGEYRVLVDQGVDVTTTSYYDAATGALIAIVSYDANPRTTECVAGPPGFVEPNVTCENTVGPDCLDAAVVRDAGGG